MRNLFLAISRLLVAALLILPLASSSATSRARPKSASRISGALEYASYLDQSVVDVGTDNAGNVYVLLFPNNNSVVVRKLVPNATGFTVGYTRQLAGSGVDQPSSIRVTPNDGRVIVTGFTNSDDFESTANALMTEREGLNAAFVTRLNPAGAVDFSTIISFRGTTIGAAANVNPNDEDGDLFVVGSTTNGAATFPITQGFGTRGGVNDAWIMRLNPNAAIDPTPANGYNENAFVYCDILGGSLGDTATDVAVQANFNATVTGVAREGGFPVSAFGYQFIERSTDLFISRMNAMGTDLLYSTRLGGPGIEVAGKIVMDSAGVVSGVATVSDSFPTSVGPFQGARSGAEDAVFFLFDPGQPSGGGLRYSSYLGGTGSESGLDVDRDSTGRVYVSGITVSANFPTRDPLQAARSTSGDMFLAVFDVTRPIAEQLLFSTYFGGNGFDGLASLAVNGSTALLGGVTTSTNLPTEKAFQSAPGPGYFLRVDPFGTPAPPGHLVVTPSRIRFPDTRVGRTKTKVLTLKNDGDGPVHGTVGTAAAPFVVQSGGGAFTLPAGESLEVVIAFSPTTRGRATATLSITSDSEGTANFNIPIQGRDRRRRR